jgi:hypothetical protein
LGDRVFVDGWAIVFLGWGFGDRVFGGNWAIAI